MFIVTAKVPQRRYVFLGALAVLAALAAVLLLRGREGGGQDGRADLRAATNEDRVAYLAALGWEVVPEPIEALHLALPEELVEPYRSYNELQAKQDFDLTPYLGKTLDRFTYAVTNYPEHPRGCQADLYLFEDTIVAGDIVCTGENGFIATLEYPKE